MKLKKILVVFVSLAIIACTAPAVAQAEVENDGLARVVWITPKPGQARALEEAITAYHKFMADKEGAWRYQWYSVVTGPDTGKYVARSGNHNWEDFDATHDWDQEAAAEFMKSVQPYIEDAEIHISRVDDELGMWPDNIDGYNYFSVTRWHVKSGQALKFTDGLERLDAMLKAGGWKDHYAITYTVSGGNGNTVTQVSPHKNFADMAPKDPKLFDLIANELGAEGASKFLAEWGPTFVTGDYFLLRYRPGLSDYGD